MHEEYQIYNILISIAFTDYQILLCLIEIHSLSIILGPRLTQMLGITLRLSTAYHSETGRQTKSANKGIE